MKRIFALILCIAMMLTLSACARKEEYTVAIGVAESVDYSAATARNTFAGVVFDEEGKVELARLDAIEYTLMFSDGTPKVYVPLAYRDSKGNDDFKTMANYLETLVVGKTKDEIKAIETVEGANKYTPELLRALVKACDSVYPIAFESKPELLGGVSAFAYVSCDATNNKVSFGVSFAAIAAEDGKIMGAVIDENEISITYDGESESITAHSYVGTKLEQGEEYHMDEYNPYALAEWYEQAAAYSHSLYYKPIDRLAAVPSVNVAGCTIATDNYFAAAIKASKRVR